MSKVSLSLYEKNGRKCGEVSLAAEIFSAPVNKRLLEQVVTAYAANQRRGTASTKTRAEVRGGGRKPWRQKGTGRARHSSIRSPLWRGGGIIFGPHPRDYYVSLPKKIQLKAISSALSQKLKEGNLLMVEEMVLDKPKTKELLTRLKSLKLDKARTLLVVNNIDDNLKRASGNLKEILKVKSAKELNAYHILSRKKLLIEKTALPLIERRFAVLPEEKLDEAKEEKNKKSKPQ